MDPHYGDYALVVICDLCQIGATVRPENGPIPTLRRCELKSK
jgi:hypothetical protein